MEKIKVYITLPDFIVNEIKGSAESNLRTMNAETVLLLIKVLGFNLKPSQVAKVLAECDAHQQSSQDIIDINNIPFIEEAGGTDKKSEREFTNKTKQKKIIHTNIPSDNNNIADLIEKVQQATGQNVNKDNIDLNALQQKVRKAVSQDDAVEEPKLAIIDDSVNNINITDSDTDKSQSRDKESEDKQYSDLLDFIINSELDDNNRSIQRYKAILQSYVNMDGEKGELAKDIISSYDYNSKSLKKDLKRAVDEVERKIQEYEEEQNQEEDNLNNIDVDSDNKKENVDEGIEEVLSIVSDPESNYKKQEQKQASTNDIQDQHEDEQEQIPIVVNNKRKKRKDNTQEEVAKILNLLNSKRE